MMAFLYMLATLARAVNESGVCNPWINHTEVFVDAMRAFTYTYEGDVLVSQVDRWQVTRVDFTEPDGDGGFLMDLTVEGMEAQVAYWGNMSTTTVEGMIDQELRQTAINVRGQDHADEFLAMEADYCSHCDTLGCLV